MRNNAWGIPFLGEKADYIPGSHPCEWVKASGPFSFGWRDPYQVGAVWKMTCLGEDCLWAVVPADQVEVHWLEGGLAAAFLSAKVYTCPVDVV
jgi:hypothetical protein